MKLNIQARAVLGIEVYEASIEWGGTRLMAHHMSWDGAYNWLSLRAKKMAREYKQAA